MVAFSLYRGNLHKVPDVPRRWRRPEQRISLKDFKILLRRRAKALSRLRSSATTPYPSRPSVAGENSDGFPSKNVMKNVEVGNRVDGPCSQPELLSNGDSNDGEAADVRGKAQDRKLVDGEDSARRLVEKVDALVDDANANKDGEPGISGNPVTQTNCTEDGICDVEKRKKEVQEKLEILKQKKHGLVQVLKQILSAEEQLKSQNSTQGTPARPTPLPLADTSTDSSSMMKLNTPRVGSDGNTCGDSEVGLAEYVIRDLHLSCTDIGSPSSDPQQKKCISKMVPPAYRTATGVPSSPSQFVATAPGQVPLSISISAASHVTSSPSPAASGGTSVLKDGRLSSPWRN